MSALAAVAVVSTALGAAPLWSASSATGDSLPARPDRLTRSMVDLAAAPAYYRPVVVDGSTFPLARSNFLSLIRVQANWHAPRLRLIDGVWQLVGVHEGIDISAERGTPILSMAAGTVESVGWTFYSGTRVGVRGSDGRYYFYAHLSTVAAGLQAGAHVDPGTLLGRVGNTGYGPPGHRDEFPPHLHFGIESGDEWTNPYPELVATYDAAVARNRADQARLDLLAAGGEQQEWERLASEVYADFALPFGE
jgi:murein DD-endopeptidase MepM/ murein hydrolase activator NlpD